MTFGLLGLLLAFTFSGAADRLDARRSQIVDEANAIGTAWLRIDVLPADAQPKLRQTFRDYVDSRIALYRTFSTVGVDAALKEYARSGAIQQDIWNQAVAAARDIPHANIVVLPALNDMFDITTTRMAATQMHPPTIVYVVLALISLICAFLVGYEMGATEVFSRAHMVMLALILVLALAMFFTSLWNWTIERVAYRPLRGSFRLAPLISAIGMSIFLMNFVQVVQGPRNKSIPPLLNKSITLVESATYSVQISYKQIVIIVTTAVLLAAFWYIVQKTPLGRAQRACEQDRKMASLLGIDVDRTISITFIMGAALAAVAGTLYLMYYGVVHFSDGFTPGVKAFTAAVLGGIGSLPGAVIGGLLIGLIETFWSAYFTTDYKDVAAFSILAITLIFLPQGILGRPDVEKV